MCRSQAEGGQRCYSHASEAYARAENALRVARDDRRDPATIRAAEEKLYEATVALASTPRGRERLETQLKDLGWRARRALSHAIDRGEEAAERNRAVLEAFTAARASNAMTHGGESRPTLSDDGTETTWKTPSGVLHRTGGPAVEREDGYRAYYQHGELHRTDGPAIEEPDGSAYYYQGGKLHRTDGPAYYDADSGQEAYYQNGTMHRLDGPALYTSKAQSWFRNGSYYRADGGPVYERTDGSGYKEWITDSGSKRVENPYNLRRFPSEFNGLTLQDCIDEARTNPYISPYA